MRVAYALALILCVGLLAGCEKSSCKKDLTGLDTAAPCQNFTAGTDAGVSGQCFVQPQICPGKGGFPFCERPVGDSFRDSVELTNMGEADLVIYSVVARGDTACAFIEPELKNSDGGVPMTVKPQETILFSFRFAPPAVQSRSCSKDNPGDEYAALVEFTTNAENFPVLRIPMCGRGIDPNDPPSPTNDAGVQECGNEDCLLMCRDVSGEGPTSCGPGWVLLAGQ